MLLAAVNHLRNTFFPIGVRNFNVRGMAAQPPHTPKQPKQDPSGAPSSAPKPASTSTKAERRAKQEKEREAKALAKASGSGKANGQKAAPSKASSSAATSSQQHKISKSNEVAKPSQVPKEVPSANSAVEALAQETRGLRIFSHFGLPKHTGPPNMKGPLHPAIFRLGLQFAEFRIVGANARCIATLNAFKTVRPCIHAIVVAHYFSCR